MKIASFNVNSVRARVELIKSWLEHRKFDINVLCFQETKTVDQEFPLKEFESLGYKCELYGQKAYNGVAICSNIELKDAKKGFGDALFDEQKRIIYTAVKGVNLINIYAPHGDERGTEKNKYKLGWYSRLLYYLKSNFSKTDDLIITGDLNIAHKDFDVYDPELLHDTINVMPEERKAFDELLKWGLTDVFRKLNPRVREFTWWDYTTAAIWRNEGMRLDYFLCTKSVFERVKSIETDLWPRKRRFPTPSDHAPVILEIS
jgi:exodeoxyribonuclease III